MKAIEDENPDLKGALPHTYTLIENWVLVELIKLLGPVDLDAAGCINRSRQPAGPDRIGTGRYLDDYTAVTGA